MRVLITGINYAPEQTGNAPYTTGLAEYLADQGYDVTVVTGMPYYPEWSVPAEYRYRLRATEERRSVRLKRLRTYVPSRQTAVHRLGFELGFYLNGFLAPRLGVTPDVVLGIVPSLGGAGLAASYARRFRVPYGLVFQDLVGAAASQSGMPGGGKVAKLVQRIECQLARNASQVAVISEGFKPYLATGGVEPSRICHLRNWTHISSPTLPRDETRRSLGWTNDDVILLHAGAMGLKQGLESAVDAARLAKDTLPKVRFVFMGDGNQRRMLEERAKGLQNVTFMPPIGSDEFPEVLAAADMLLINERHSLRDMALPSKLTSYLVAGRPIIAAVAPDGWTAREVRRTGAGTVVPAGKPESLVSAVRHLVEHPEAARALACAGPAYAQSTLRSDVVLSQYVDFIHRIRDPAAAAMHQDVRVRVHKGVEA